MNKIIYVGNDLTDQTNYKTSMSVICSNLDKEGIEVIKTSSKLSKLYRLFDMISTLFKNKDVNIVFIDTFSTQSFYYALIVSQFCRVLKLPYAPVLRGGNLPNRLMRTPFLSKLIFQNSIENIAPSKFLVSEFSKYNFKTKYIPNTIELNNYTFNKREFDCPRIFWLRAFRQLYNPIMAINVLKELKEIYPKASLCMVGPFKDNSIDECKSLADKHNLSDSIVFTGVLSRDEWIRKSVECNIFLNTTNVDNTPVSVIEAMALGLQVVSTNVGGIPYLLENNIDSYLVNKDDVQSTSKTIIDLFNGNKPSTADEARRKAESFDWSVVKEKWIELIKSVEKC